MGEQPRFILFDIRLPRILMALLCGPCWGWPARRCRASPVNGAGRPGADRRQRGASIVVLALVLFFPAVAWSWRPLAGMVGGIAVAPVGPDAGRDCSRPRFILIGIARLLEPGGRESASLTTADVRDGADGDDLAWRAAGADRHLAAAGGGFAGRCRGHRPVPCTARAADVALLGDRDRCRPPAYVCSS